MRFIVGMEFEHGGILYRVLKGNRREGDMVLEFRTVQVGWHRPRIAHTMILLDFKYQVEENNYPKPRYQGGEKLMKAMWYAVLEGWELQAAEIAQERVALVDRELDEANQIQTFESSGY
jgi:hypothetical protein